MPFTLTTSIPAIWHQVARGGVPADQLDHDVDVGARDDLPGGRGELDAFERDRALLLEIARARHLDDDVAAGAARDLLAVAAQHLDGAAADRPEAEQSNLDGLQENLMPVDFLETFLSKWNEVIVIPSRK